MTKSVEQDLSRLLVDLHNENDFLIMKFSGSDFSLLAAEELSETHIPVGKGDALRLYDLCLKSWKQVYDRRKFRLDLDAIIDVGTKKLSKKKVARLKEVRKTAATIRSLQYVFDKKHKGPRLWRCFVRDFGKLNDAIAAGQDNKAKKLARALRKMHGSRRLAKVFDSFRPAPASDIAAFFEQETRQIVSFLHHDALPCEEFHTLRKGLKNFMNVLRIADDSKRQDQQVTRLKEYLLSINDAFGTINDIIVTLELKREINPDQVKIKLVPEMRLGVANAVSVIRFSA